MTDKLFIPARFIGLFADMPPASAPIPARERWLAHTHASLMQAVPTERGMQAVRLIGVIEREYRSLTGGLR